MNNLNFNDFLDCVNEKGLTWFVDHVSVQIKKISAVFFTCFIDGKKIGYFVLAPSYVKVSAVLRNYDNYDQHFFTNATKTITLYKDASNNGFEDAVNWIYEQNRIYKQRNK